MTIDHQGDALHKLHSRQWRGNKYVYPVISRRSHGLSIGVNLNPDGLCNFDCIYCSSEQRMPASAVPVDLSVLRAELEEMLETVRSGQLFHEEPFDCTRPELRRLNDIAFSGDGEPTSCARFPDACKTVADVVGRYVPGAKIVLITNATLLRRPVVKEVLRFLDDHSGEVWAKLDAGTQEYYEHINRSSIPLTHIVANILDAAKVRPVVIQSLFMKIHDVRPSDRELLAYVQRLKDLVEGGAKIKLVQIYTVLRPPNESYVRPVERHVINRIVRRVRRIGLNAEGYYGEE
jgi:wyosine [tRNA(Phe)-imidazoG37] synthetase (radical SAM superfamily)